MSDGRAGGGSERSSGRWTAIARLALAGTAVCIGVSLLATYLLFFSDALSPLARSLLLAVVVPVLVAAPLLVFIGLKLQELRGMRQSLNRLATFDQTTGLMNGKALATVIDRRVASAEAEDSERGGFLVMRIDNLSEINMRHGFHHGDEVLRLVAAAIRASVRESDTVGRLGAAEFGLFLPGASEANAREAGERIRAAIGGIAFAPGGQETAIEVSAGGIVFEQDFGFGEMLRGAELQRASAGSKGGLALARAGDASGWPHPTTH